jgi:hypothetical protein
VAVTPSNEPDTRPDLPSAHERSLRLHQRAVVVDTHAHSASFLPRPVAAVLRFANRKTMPADVPFSDLTAAGVDAIVG